MSGKRPRCYNHRLEDRTNRKLVRLVKKILIDLSIADPVPALVFSYGHPFAW